MRVVMVLVVGCLFLGVLGTGLGSAPVRQAPATTPTAAPDPAAGGPTTSAGGDGDRPNIVLVTTDDMRLDEMKYMPFTRRLIGRAGVRFPEALSPHPLCCPARAEILTGQYGHNNGVTHNAGPTGGFGALDQPGNTIGSWLQDAGYRTALVGKYLNQYGRGDPPQQGWTEWNPSVAGTYSFTDTTFYNDGEPQRHRQYVADVVTGYTNGYISQWADGDQPFFIWVSHLAPHAAIERGTSEGRPAIPALRHMDELGFQRNPARSKPSYAARSVEAAEGWWKPARRKKAQRTFRARIRSLQAVDESVRSMVRRLRETGELDDTYIFFASDNGFMLGEHRLMGKNYLYDEALRVPLQVRVPGTEEPASSRVPVTVTDLAPTFVELAGAAPGRPMDGDSFAPVLDGERVDWRDTQLVQTGESLPSKSDMLGWSRRGVRTSRYTYFRSRQDGRDVLHDRRADPFELHNRADDPAYAGVTAALDRRLARLQGCAEEECRRDFGSLPRVPVQSPKPRDHTSKGAAKGTPRR